MTLKTWKSISPFCVHVCVKLQAPEEDGEKSTTTKY